VIKNKLHIDPRRRMETMSSNEKKDATSPTSKSLSTTQKMHSNVISSKELKKERVEEESFLFPL
jgi:hypothetical protein